MYMATAQSHKSCLSVQPCLGIEMFHMLERKKNHQRLHVFRKKAAKNREWEEIFKMSSCDLIYNNNCSFIHFTLLLLKKGGKEA